MIMNKKYRSYVLCIILLSSLTWFSLIQVTEADNPLFADGSGTESDPYQISTVEQLQNMNQDPEAYYVLVCDIDASETINWNNGKGFKPIAMDGSSDYAFQGTRFTGNLDGRGYTITGLYINRPSLDFVGLIGHHLSGTISNLGLVDCDITGNNRVGGLIGHNKGPVKNCYVTGKVNGNTYVGGFTGRFQQSTSDYFEITNSYAIVEVNGNRNVGGFIGYKPGGILVNCYSAGPVTGNSGVGGLVASKTHGASTNCFWDTETSGQSSSAGGTGKTTPEMKDVATYTDTSNTGLSTPWDFVNDPNDDTASEDIWSIDPEVNNGYSDLIPPSPPNQAPVADAGNPQTVEQQTPTGAEVTLDGSDSYDPDDDPLTYQWTWDDNSATGVTPTITLPPGTTIVTLVVNDGTIDSEPNTVEITVQDTTPPIVTIITEPQTVEQASYEGTEVTIEGTAEDTCDPELEYTWYEGTQELGTGKTLTHIFTLGTHIIRLESTDDSGNTGIDTVEITVQDTTPPEIMCDGASPNILWPPNHKYRDVQVDIKWSDTCDPDPEVDVKVTSNEPINTNGFGDGNTEPDWVIIDNNHFKLRAERDGRGTGCTYTITYTITDASGNISTESCTVTVPHNQGKGKGRKR